MVGEVQPPHHHGQGFHQRFRVRPISTASGPLRRSWATCLRMLIALRVASPSGDCFRLVALPIFSRSACAPLHNPEGSNSLPCWTSDDTEEIAVWLGNPTIGTLGVA